MMPPEELKHRIRFRIRTFLEALDAEAHFTTDELVTVIWPEINEASARDAVETMQDELQRVGLGAKPHHANPTEYSSREKLTDTLTAAVLPFAEQHQWLDIAVDRNELLEKLETLRRLGVVWAWSDGVTESETDGGDDSQPDTFALRMTMCGILALVTRLERDPEAAGTYRELLREVMNEESLGR